MTSDRLLGYNRDQNVNADDQRLDAWRKYREQQDQQAPSQSDQACPRCNGSGYSEADKGVCTRCNGYGTI